MSRMWSLPAVVAVGLLAVTLTGCSSEGKMGTVSGTVTVDGKPAEGVALTFAAADGRVATARSDDQGHYTASNVPVGGVTVTAYGMGEDGGESSGMIMKNRGAADPTRPPQAAAPTKKKGPKVADRFSSASTSGLTHTATEGESKFDVPLSSK